MEGQNLFSAALSGVFCVSDAEKLRGQVEMIKLIKVLSNIKVFKTSDDVTRFLTEKGFETFDMDVWTRTLKMRCFNLVVEIQELKENNLDYVVSCHSVQPDV